MKPVTDSKPQQFAGRQSIELDFIQALLGGTSLQKVVNFPYEKLGVIKRKVTIWDRYLLLSSATREIGA